MNDDPLMILIYVGIAAYLGKLYRDDYLAARQGQPNPKALPGAVPASRSLFIIGIAGALVILAGETLGEIALGVSGEQSDMVVLYLFAILAAGVIEEVVFRGFLVVADRGKAALVASCAGFSLLFALIHPFLWEYVPPEEAASWMFWEGRFDFDFGAKGIFSTLIVFGNSLWFYALRFGPGNPSRSIFPCMAAHAASNFGVFVIKLTQGHVTGWY
jgi:membrane protease YdiL (CAAX protease family)